MAVYNILNVKLKTKPKLHIYTLRGQIREKNRQILQNNNNKIKITITSF